MRRLLLGGIDIAYETSGPADAPALVLCHSLGTSMHLWARQWGPLTRDFRVLRYDIRGHGATGATAGDYTIAMLAADLLVLLDELEVGRAHFCGVSIGGVIGQWLAIHAPHRLRRIVLANTAARIGTRENWDARIAVVREQGLTVIADATIGRWFTPEYVAREPSEGDSFRRTLLSTSVDGYVGCCAALRDADLRSEVSSIEHPTLVVAGAMDQATPPSDAAWLAEQIPNARLLSLPAAHLANVEASVQFNEAVMAFLSDPGGAT